MQDRPILLVEDNPDDEEMTVSALKDQRIANQILVVRDGAEALEYLFATGRFAGRETGEDPGLVLLDLKLPKVGGLEVLSRVRSHSRTELIPVVVLTSSSEDEDIVSSYKLGANAYVRKPVVAEQFRRAVGNLGIFWMLVNEPPVSAR